MSDKKKKSSKAERFLKRKFDPEAAIQARNIDRGPENVFAERMREGEKKLMKFFQRKKAKRKLEERKRRGNFRKPGAE